MITKDYFISDAKYVELDIPIDHNGILEEAKFLKDYFITHRQGSYDHKGWKSLVLHGWSESQSGHWKDYGYEKIDDVIKELHWTEISKKCPKTVNFIKTQFPSKLFGRIRFMLLESGGYISEHTDSRVPMLDNTNISLNNPKDCLWHWGDGSSLYMIPGKTYVMNIHYPHSIKNDSLDDRYHLIIHRLDSTSEWKNLLNNACKKQGIVGTYYEHEVLT